MRVLICPHCRDVLLADDDAVHCGRLRCTQKQAEAVRWLALARAKHARRRGPCGQLLYDDYSGRPTARCTVRWGTEHSHHDHTAEEAVEAGLAEAV